jgi:urease accessory protein
MNAGSPAELHLPPPYSIHENRVAPVPPPRHGWSAGLRLEYALRDERCYLSHKSHQGPLAVQKSLYPEGPAVCHTLIVHPPGGIAGGDALHVGIEVQAGSHALITMPGAAKWYRSNGAWATQRLKFNVAAGAVLEWLPPETIIYNGAIARLEAEIELEQGGRYLGWELMCLGRGAAGEKFTRGTVRQRTDVSAAGDLAWSERSGFDGSSPLLASPVGLAGASVSGVLIAAGRTFEAGQIAQLRAVVVEPTARCGLSGMPNLLVARYLGDSCEQAKRYFVALWRVLRPLMAGRDAVAPRIWNT